jgi:hypothetical protein
MLQKVWKSQVIRKHSVKETEKHPQQVLKERMKMFYGEHLKIGRY